ncbi:MAG: hypothetical protein AAF387_08190 [Pseudomonadota bacterium]
MGTFKAIILLIALGAVVSGAFAAGDKNSPHVNYMLHCQGCHLPKGIGHPGLVPKLTDHVGKFLSVEGGRAYLIQVPGVAQSNLDDETLAEVLNWLIPTFDPVNTPDNFAPFTAKEIGTFRPTRIRAVSEIRQKLLNDYRSTNN